MAESTWQRLAPLDPDHVHHFHRQPGHLDARGIIGQIDPSAFERAVALLAFVAKRYLVAIEHHGIDDPLAAFALHMRNHPTVVRVSQLGVRSEQFRDLFLLGHRPMIAP